MLTETDLNSCSAGIGSGPTLIFSEPVAGVKKAGVQGAQPPDAPLRRAYGVRKILGEAVAKQICTSDRES